MYLVKLSEIERVFHLMTINVIFIIILFTKNMFLNYVFGYKIFHRLNFFFKKKLIKQTKLNV